MSSNQYGYWRTDKAKEPGFSHEFISSDYKHISHQTTLDKLEYQPGPGIDTLL